MAGARGGGGTGGGRGAPGDTGGGGGAATGGGGGAPTGGGGTPMGGGGGIPPPRGGAAAGLAAGADAAALLVAVGGGGSPSGAAPSAANGGGATDASGTGMSSSKASTISWPSFLTTITCWQTRHLRRTFGRPAILSSGRTYFLPQLSHANFIGAERTPASSVPYERNPDRFRRGPSSKRPLLGPRAHLFLHDRV